MTGQRSDTERPENYSQTVLIFGCDEDDSPSDERSAGAPNTLTRPVYWA